MEKELENQTSKAKWTKEELDKHIQINTKSIYSMIVVLVALYKKLYGTIPSNIGLSGFQGETAEKLADLFPTPIK